MKHTVQRLALAAILLLSVVAACTPSSTPGGAGASNPGGAPGASPSSAGKPGY